MIQSPAPPLEDGLKDRRTVRDLGRSAGDLQQFSSGSDQEQVLQHGFKQMWNRMEWAFMGDLRGLMMVSWDLMVVE